MQTMPVTYPDYAHYNGSGSHAVSHGCGMQERGHRIDVDFQTVKVVMQEIVFALQSRVVCIRQLIRNLQYKDTDVITNIDEITNVIRVDELQWSMLLLSLDQSHLPRLDHHPHVCPRSGGCPHVWFVSVACRLCHCDECHV